MAILRRVSKATGKASYQVMVDRRDPATGKRKRLVIGTFGTKKEAQAAERTALVQKDRGILIDPSKTTVAELLDSWLTNKRGEISTNSAWDYDAAIRLYLRPALGMMAPRDLTPDLLQGQYVSWQAAGVSPRMLHRLHLVLSQALGEAVRFDRIARNVAREVRKPSIHRRRANVWTADEVRRFLEAADGNRLSPLWHLLVLEGMRRGEALGLRWQDVNWERGRAHISQTVTVDKANRGAAMIQDRTKTASGARTVRLTAETLAVLREHRGHWLARRMAAEHWADHDLIVCRPDGMPVSPNTIGFAFGQLVERAGLPRIRVHDLRHTSATLMLRAGVPAKIVSERLGHAGIRVTLDVYSHVLPDMQDDAAEAMDRIMAEARTAT